MRPIRWLLIALAIGLAIRVPLLVHAQRQGVPGDQLQYSAQALANARGDWFEQPFVPGMPSAEHPPLTSLVLTPITWIVGEQGMELAQRLVVLTAGIANIFLFWRLGRRWSPRVASVAAMVAAVDAHLFLGDVLIFSETFGTTLLALLLLHLTAPTPTMERHRWRAPLVTGALLGLLVLTRAELALLVPMVVLWSWFGATDRRRWPVIGRALLPAFVAGVVVAPWVTWNLVRFQEPVTFSTNDGLTFLGANCDDTYYGENIGGWSIWCGLEIRDEPGDDPSVAAARRMDAAVAYAREHVDRLPLVATARVVRQWELGWIGRLASDSTEEGRPPWLVLAGSIQWYLFAPLAAVGLRHAGRRRRALLLLLPLQVTIVAAVIEPQWRLRLPAEPAIVILTAIGLVAVWERQRTRPVSAAG